MFSLLLLLLLDATSGVVGQAQYEDKSSVPVVNLTYSVYQGLRTTNGVDQYLGMRYAQPPLGDLRFRAPLDPSYVEGVQDATKFGPLCLGSGQNPSSSLAEDCLFVNVFLPSNATRGSKLPVWVYFPGGGYATNSNSNYNGSNVVQQSGYSIVQVNFNYRVGALGFLASEEIRKDGDLNAGLLDQRKLLWWVKKHIQEFGGDPDHVVIHGTSAGAGSVTHHLTAYGGRNDKLFAGVAVESVFWPPQRSVAHAEFQYDQFVDMTGCSNTTKQLVCLRSANLSTIAAANRALPLPGANSSSPVSPYYFLPVVDGNLIRGSLYQQILQGDFVKVPLLISTCTDEGTHFASDAATASDMMVFFKNYYPYLNYTQLQSIVDEYPLRNPLPKHEAWFPSAAAAYGDATLICPAHSIAASVAAANPSVWYYRFNMQDPSYIAQGLGVIHAIDTAAIFGPGFTGSYAASFKTINAPIVPETMHYYISFVRSLSPNKFRYPTAKPIPPYARESPQQLVIQTNATRSEYVTEDLLLHCEYWKSLVHNMEL